MMTMDERPAVAANEDARPCLSPRTIVLIADMALLLCALLWGASFATMKILVAVYPTCWLLFLRFASGSALIALFFHRRIAKEWRRALKGGVVIGALLFAAIGTQTFALTLMDAGRQAFVTATYVLMVPLLLWASTRKFPGWTVLVAACVCLAGMALLTDLSGPIAVGDALTLLCAVFFALQIIAIGHYAKGTDPVVLSFVEFVTMAVLSSVVGTALEGPLVLSSEGWGELVFTIVFCTFGCYVVQTCAQRYAPPSHAAILMSLESVFGLLSGIVFLGEVLTLRMGIGCAMIFASVLIAELAPFLRRHEA